MGVAVVLAVVERLHELRRRVAQVQGHGARAVALDEGFGLVEGLVDGVRFGRDRQVDHALAQRKLALGRAESLVDFARVEREPQRARVGQTDVLRRHAYEAARHVARVYTAVEHAHEPIQRRVGVGAAHALVQRADGVVELFAALVVAAHALAQHLEQPGVGDGGELLARGGHGQGFQRIQQAARVAIGIGDETVKRGLLDGGDGVDGARLGHDGTQVVLGERLQHVHRRARQQRRVDFERGVFGGGADESEQPAFDVRQKGVLLAFIEAVHLVDKDDGALRVQAVARELGLLHRLADVLHAPQHRADGDELGIERVGHEPRDGGLAHARRAPEDAAVRLAGFEGQAQRHALAQQVLLADHLAQGARAQALGQGRVREWAHWRITSAPAGGSKRKSPVARPGLACQPLKVSSERWPRPSSMSSTASCLARRPTRTRWSWPSRAFGTASTHCSPSLSGRALKSKAERRDDRSPPEAISAAGVLPNASFWARTVTWFRSTSCSQSRWPSATMVCSKGLA